MEIVKFDELEEKIRSILKDYSLLKERNQELEELLRNKGLELEGVKVSLNELNEERNAIRTKVDSLLNMLQEMNMEM